MALIIGQGFNIPPLDPHKVLDRWELHPAGLVLVAYPGEVIGVYQVKTHDNCKNILTNSPGTVILKISETNYCYLVFKEPLGYIANGRFTSFRAEARWKP